MLAILAVSVASGPTIAGAQPAERGAKTVRSLIEIRDEGVVRQHWDLSCGAAAIATILTYQLDDPVAEREVALALMKRATPLMVRVRLGFSLLELKRYAESRGLEATAYGGMTLDDLVAMAPAIAPVKLNGMPHFVVVRGARGGKVLVADPSFGNRTLSYEEFRSTWNDGVGFKVFRPGREKALNRMGAPGDQFLTPSDQALRATVANFGSGASIFATGHP
jgi:predicted double-glycine peptidase